MLSAAATSSSSSSARNVSVDRSKRVQDTTVRCRGRRRKAPSISPSFAPPLPAVLYAHPTALRRAQRRRSATGATIGPRQGAPHRVASSATCARRVRRMRRVRAIPTPCPIGVGGRWGAPPVLYPSIGSEQAPRQPPGIATTQGTSTLRRRPHHRCARQLLACHHRPTRNSTVFQYYRHRSDKIPPVASIRVTRC